jgi:TetR/AcrR family fatty acid metabolism transcriptional regulator
VYNPDKMASTAATDTKRRRSREETRQRLVEAALEVFARNGYERSTVDEIVREAGYSKGAFYVHFETKEDLFWELLEERIEAQQEVFRAAIDPSLTVEENERRVLEIIFNLQERDELAPAVYLEFTAHAMRNEKVRARLSEFYARWHAFVAETLTLGRDAGVIRPDIDITLLASVLMAVFEGSMIQSRLAPPELRLNKRVDDLARLLSEWVTGNITPAS